MTKSNWEDAKKRSNYHFNNDIIDKNNIKHIGKFIGSWKKEVDEVINDAKKLILHFSRLIESKKFNSNFDCIHKK